MKKFMVLCYSTQEANENMQAMSQEQQQEIMSHWYAWKEKLGDQLVDMGSPLMNGMTPMPDGTSSPSKSEVSGFSIVQAESMEDILVLMKDYPVYEYGPGNTIEVFEMFDM